MLLKLSLFAASFLVLEGRNTVEKIFCKPFEKNSFTASKLKLTLFTKKGRNTLIRNYLRAKRYYAFIYTVVVFCLGKDFLI